MICHVVGARPNLVKASAVLKYRPDDYLIHTGQHWDRNLGDLLGLVPDENLDCRFSHLSGLVHVLSGRFGALSPSKVVVYGDVNTTLAAALAATHSGVPVAHVEAGLRCNDLSMPEEVNRRATDAVSSQWFTTEPDAIKNLCGAGHFVGNPMIDRLADLGVTRGSGGPGVVTLHRQANLDDRARCDRIVDALNDAAESYPMVAVLHPRSERLRSRLSFPSSPPQPYESFVRMLADAAFVITDSGGVQEETTWLGVPCLTMRPSTERPVTVNMGSNRLTTPDRLLSDLADPPTRLGIPPLWDGHAGARIAGLL